MAFDPSTAVLEFDPSSATEDDFSFDSSSAVDTTPGIVKDTYNRGMGGGVIGLTTAGAGTSRWAEMVTKANSALSGAISEKLPDSATSAVIGAVSSVSDAVSKEFGSIAQTLEDKTKEVKAYKESQTDRSRDDKFSAQLVEAGGNFAGQIALTAAGRVPGIIANVGQMFEQEYSSAKAQGKDDLLAYQAGVSNMPAAFLDYFMESKIAKSLVPVKRTVGTVAKKLFTNAGLEGATEVLQDEYSNWIAGNALKYDESRSVQERFSAANLPETGKQIATTFAIGSILGGTATGAFEAIQPSQVDEKGLAKESRLDALQKELDLINETQEKTKISTTEPSAIVPTTIPETTGDTPTTPVSEVSRVRAEVDPIYREHVNNINALQGQEREDYIKKFDLNPDEFEGPQMSLEGVPVAPVTETQPITQPKAIPGIPSETDLKKVDVLKRATDVIREGWQHAPQIEVVHDVTSIPDEAMTPAEKEAIQGKTADGLFGKDGKVYLIGQSVPSIQRAKEIILHETKAHYGFKSLFGSDESSYRKAMQSALDEFDARPKLADALAQRGGFKDLADLTQSYSHLNIEHKEGKYALTEELLSRAAEVYHDPTKDRPTWFNRVISRIKVALQPLMPGMRLNDQDIVNLLGTKSTELLDVASQKVETGKAEIPKFSLKEPKLSLSGETDSELSSRIRQENAEKYFEIGQASDEEMENNDNWIYDKSSMSIKAKKGGTHGINFGHEIADKTFKGWYDRQTNKISVVFPESEIRKLGDKKPTVEDIPNTVFNALKRKFRNPRIEMVAFSISGKTPAPAVHIGDQEFEGQRFPFFNLTEAIPGHSKDSTVSADTLIDAGYAPPEGYSGGFEKSNLPMLSLTGHPQSDKILNDLNSVANKAKTKLFDDLNALAVVEKGLNLGSRLNATLSAWTAALQTRNIANVMKGVFTDGMIQYNSAKGMFEKATDSVGMQAIFEPLTKAGLMDKWDNYAKGKRAQTLVKQKLGVPWQAASNEDVKKLTGFTKDEANQWISDGQADATVVKSHQDYQKHNEKIRDFALQTGLISPQQKAAMDQLLDYVPFFREMDTEGNVKERGRAGLSGQSSGIKELKGSERNILPLLESITAQTSRIIDAGMKNIASQRAVAVMQAGGVAERVPTATQPVSKTLQSIQTDLSNLGVEFNKLPQSAKDQLTALMYGPQKQTTAAASDPNVVSVRVNGKLQYYKTEDPTLAQALQSLSKPEENFFMMVLGAGKTLQTVTATTNPGFAIANLIRDTLSTFVQSGDTKHLFRVAKGLVKSFQESPELKSIQQAGSGGSAFLNIDPKSIRDVLKSDNFWQNRWNDKLFMKTVWSGWKQVLYAAENANRVAIYDKVIEQGGTPAEAAFQAQDTLNFQMHGASRSLQMLSAAIPFLNARMQGAYKIGRSGSADPKGVALRGGLLVLASLGLWALNKLDRSDEDSNGKNWYERLSNNDKALYWHIKVPGTNEIVRIPKPFEMGTLFATIPEVMADAIADPKELGRSAKIAGTSTAQALPVVGDFIANLANTGNVGQSILAATTGNPLIKAPIELAANRNMFFNAPIVTNQNAPKQAQYNDRTSATARAIGDVTGASPQEADYVINTIFSGLTPYILLASDSVAKSVGYQGAMQKEAKDYLGIGRFTKDSETMSNRYTPDFYELKNQVDDTYAKARWMATEATEQAALQNFEKENTELLAMRKPIQAAQKELKSIKEELSMVRGGSSSTDDKRSKEEALLKQRNEVLAKTMKFYQDLLEKKGRGRMP